MSFYIENDNGIACGTWYVGTKKPPIKPNRISFLQADGDELRQIQIQFTGIPNLTYDGICKWRGEMAQFIFENLQS